VKILNIKNKIHRFVKNRKIDRTYLKNELAVIKKILGLYPEFFKTGKFKLLTRGRRVYYQKNRTTLLFIDRFFQHVNGKRDIASIGIVLWIKIHVAKLATVDILFKLKTIIIKDVNSNPYQCEVFIPIAGNGGIKAFSFKENKVIRFFYDDVAFDNTLKGIEATPNEINTPILEVDVNRKIIIEELLVPQSVKELSNKKLDKIFQVYHTDLLQFLARLTLDEVTTLSSKEVFDFLFLDFFTDDLKEFLLDNFNLDSLIKSTENIPLLEFKNDLGFHNFIIHKKGYAVIDFEGVTFVSIFNLLLTYMKSLFNDYDVAHLLASYKKGEYDSIFSTAFKSLGLKFDTKLRTEYFLLSLLPYNFYLNYKKNPNDLVSIESKDLIISDIKKYLENYLNL